MDQIKYIDLFCGIGSFHYSFQKFGWECVMASDINKAASDTYRANYNMTTLGDIIDIEPSSIPQYDILCSGLPCQPFSQCGKQKGFDDIRGTLFFNVMKFVRFHKPKVLILENVQGLLTHDNGKTFTRIKKEIEEANYTVTYKVVKCSDYGLPQMRKRIIIVGVRNDILLVKEIESLLIFDEFKRNVSLSTLLSKNFEKEFAYTIRCGGRKSPINDRHNWDGYLVDGKEYRLTIEDCLQIQGYDKNFMLCGTQSDKWKQLGNTIPTIFTEIIGLNLKKNIELL